jgi:hypothetical protein
MQRIKSLSALTAILLAACSTPKAPEAPAQMPAYLTAETGCAVILGGAIGDYFGEKEIDAFWSAANSKIASQLQSNLQASGYRTENLTITLADRSSITEVLGKTMASRQCSFAIQLSHTISEDAQGNFFQYELVVFRAMPQSSKDGSLKMKMDKVYSKPYRYRRTSAILRSFQIDDFARLLESDLKASGALSRLQRAS